MTDQEVYETYKRRSTTGASGKRDPNRRIRMKYKDYKRTLAAVSIATAITVSGLIAGGSHLVDKIQESMVLGELHHDFRMEYIVPETHRTQDNQHYFYDYIDIANHLKNYGDFELGVYLLETDIGEYQTDRVLAYTDYKTCENYITQAGYKDQDEFKKSVEKRVTLQHENEKNQEEINRMLAEHQIEKSEEDNYTGGSK